MYIVSTKLNNEEKQYGYIDENTACNKAFEFAKRLASASKFDIFVKQFEGESNENSKYTQAKTLLHIFCNAR